MSKFDAGEIRIAALLADEADLDDVFFDIDPDASEKSGHPVLFVEDYRADANVAETYRIDIRRVSV